MHQVEIIIIAALCKTNRAIGLEGRMPWSTIKEDLKRFKALTMGSPIIMGRTTYENIDALPGRTNLIVSKSMRPTKNLYVCNTLSSAINKARDASQTGQLFIIGGANIYNQTIQMADRLELTIIEKEYKGDTFFPALPKGVYKLANSDQQSGFVYETYNRYNA